MSEATVSSQRSIRFGRLSIEQRQLLRLVAIAILLALAVAVILLRFQKLDELPPGILNDESRDGGAALGVLQGEHAIFFTDVVHQGQEPSTIYALALSTLLFGRTLFALHFPTALGSAGMVFAAFWLGRLLFGRDEDSEHVSAWRGLLVGGVGAGLMAVSISQTILGRTGYNKITHMPLLLTLCLGLLWWGWGERSWRRVALAGVCAGLLPYTYMPARFVPFLFFFLGLSFFPSLRTATLERVREELRWTILFAGVAGLVAAPLLIYFVLNPDHFFLRSEHLWILNPARTQGNPLGAFFLNVWDHLSLLGLRGDPVWRHNYAGQPMLNPVEALFFWFGVGTAAWRWRKPAYRLLLIWLATMMLPAFLATDFLGPSFMRILGAAPAIYLLLGVGVWQAFSLLRERLFRRNGTRAAFAAGLVISIGILVQGIDSYRTYFHKWATAPGVLEDYQWPWPDVVQALNAKPSAADEVYLFPRFSGYDQSYLYQGEAEVHHFHPAKNDLAQKVESALRKSEELSTVKVVEWTGDFPWLAYDPGNLAFLLSKYGRHEGGEEYPYYRVHNFTHIILEGTWSFHEGLETFTVDYDGGIALQGLALGQGPEQMSARQVLDLGRGRPLWMAMQWQTAPGQDVDYSISLRLYNNEGERVHQEDAVLRRWTGSLTSQWWSKEAVEFLTTLAVPETLPAGEYQLRLVVYDLETLTPTVEIGVWEPETTLARLQFGEVE